MDTLLVIWLLGCLAILVFGLLPTFRKRKPPQAMQPKAAPGEIPPEEIWERWRADQGLVPKFEPQANWSEVVAQESAWLARMANRQAQEQASRDQLAAGVAQGSRSGRSVVEFDYVDYEGEPSSRVVTLEYVRENDEGESYIYGYCRLRRDRRTFKIERMSNIRVDGKSMSQADLDLFARDAVKVRKARHW